MLVSKEVQVLHVKIKMQNQLYINVHLISEQSTVTIKVFGGKSNQLQNEMPILNDKMWIIVWLCVYEIAN